MRHDTINPLRLPLEGRSLRRAVVEKVFVNGIKCGTLSVTGPRPACATLRTALGDPTRRNGRFYCGCPGYSFGGMLLEMKLRLRASSILPRDNRFSSSAALV